MMTIAEPIRAERAARESPVKANSTVPRHLAVVLNDRATKHRNVQSELSIAALRAMLTGCSEKSVAVLTLIRPIENAGMFDAAVTAARAAEPHASDVHLNLVSPRSGREDLLESVRQLAAQAKRGGVESDAIDSVSIENNLSTRGLPPVDLLIVTGGGATLSGALLWQSAYAELLFVDGSWTEFSRADFDAALADYAKRCRKFGGLA
jgi:undecaprenyl diphosphate synthase